MGPSRLVAVILSGSFALQLVLAGSGVTCIDPSHGSTAAWVGADHQSMAGMEMAMADMDMAMDMTRNGVGNGTANHAEDIPARGETPCERPVTTVICQLLAPCAGGFFASTLADLDSSGRLASHVAGHRALVLSSRSIPPELPPPRA